MKCMYQDSHETCELCEDFKRCEAEQEMEDEE